MNDTCAERAPEEDSWMSLCARKCADRCGYDECDELAKMRGNILFIKGLQPGRHPHATPTALSMDMMMKVEPPYPIVIVLVSVHGRIMQSLKTKEMMTYRMRRKR